jgi:cobalt-zinc-cadmium efflux system membrane fusion protein
VTLAPEALEAARLSVSRAKKGPRVSSVRAVGTLDFDPQRVARVGPMLDGRVTKVQVIPGDTVASGSVLATLVSLDVGRTRADLQAARARLIQAEASLSREKKLLESRATSEREVVEAETGVRVARIEQQAAADRLRAAGAGAGAGASLALTSPIAGRVLSVDARIGQPVRATDTLFLVGDTAVLWLVIDVYERDLGRIKVGDPVRVTVIARPGKVVEGKVAYVHGLIDPVRRVASARVVLPNEDGELLAGMSATARVLTGGGAGEVVTVPRGAIQSVDGQPFVFIELAPGRYEMRAVERGEDLEDEVEIRQGLAGGEPVVHDGSFLLKSQVLREQMGSND